MATVEELDALLDELDRESRDQTLPSGVSLWTGPHPDGKRGYALTLAVGTTISPVDWSAPMPSYGRSSWNGGAEETPVFAINYGGDRSEFDAWMLVPIADAREAARRFFISGGACPDNIT